MLSFRIMLATALLGCAFCSLSAQAFFQKTYDFPRDQDNPVALKVLDDGGVALLGRISDTSSLVFQASLTRLDENGEPLWSKLLVSGIGSYGADVALAPDGNFLVALNITDADIVDSRPALLKVSAATGDVLWHFHFSVPDMTVIRRVVALKNGGYGLLFSRREQGFNQFDAITILCKIEENGAVAWEKTWAGDEGVFCLGLAENSAAEIYAAGFYRVASNQSEALLIKLTQQGDVLWQKSYNGGMATHIIADASDRIWLGGISSAPGFLPHPWIQQTDGEGNVLLSKLYVSDAPNGLELSGLTGLPNGDLAFCAHDFVVNRSNALVARIGPDGALRWARKYAASADNDYPESIDRNQAGELLIGGVTGPDYFDLATWLIKTDPEGRIPGCCIPDFGLNALERPSLSTSLVLQLTDSLTVQSGTVSTEDLMPVSQTLCSAEAASDSGPANAFTPDGDNLNDRFRPRFECPPASVHFAIFNRWGDKVFETSDPDTPGWDGAVNAEPAPTDVYLWVLEYEVSIDGRLEKKLEKGEITLLR